MDISSSVAPRLIHGTAMPNRVRTFRPADTQTLVELTNRCLAPYAGWVPRTPEYWLWATLARPGVDAADVLVLESDTEIVGYTVLWEEGAVLDFLVDPDQRPRKRRALARQLIDAAESRAKERGFDKLTLNLPLSDHLIDTVLRKSGYVVAQNEFFSLGILNPRVLLQALVHLRAARLTSTRIRSFVFELSPGQYPLLLSSRLILNLDPSVQVEDISDAIEYPTQCIIRIDICSLTELIFCGASVDSLLGQSQLQVAPAAAEADARTLLGALVVDAPWFIPGSDRF
jgi:ribosomal protein S18 acetylase RimI-like enzyme